MSARSVHRFGLSTNLATRFALALLLGAGAAAAEMSAAPTILRIERNKNRNAVHYRARMSADCSLLNPPVEVVWQMQEQAPPNEQALLLLGAGAAAAEMSAAPIILRIERNKNRNAVHYRARMSADCSLLNPPVEVVWQMQEQAPPTEQALLPREEPAYGYRLLTLGQYQATLVLRAVPDRVLTLHSQSGDERCEVKLTGQIAGQLADMTRVYVYAREQGWLPRVEWLELYGTGTTGPVQERIEP